MYRRSRVCRLAVLVLSAGGGLACGRLGYEAVAPVDGSPALPDGDPRDGGADRRHDAADIADGADRPDATGALDAATNDATPDNRLAGPDVPPADAGPMPGDAALPSPDGAPAGDGGPPGDGSAPPETGPPPDADPHPLPSCTPELEWTTEFDGDPALRDDNGDGLPDWAWARSTPSPPSRYRDGAWFPVGGEILDSRPLRPWNTRTIAFARMQNLSVDRRLPFAKGALVWLNLDNDLPNIIAISLSLLASDDGNQTLHLNANGQPGEHLHVVPGLPARPVDVVLDVDPRALHAELWIDGQWQGRFAVPRAPHNPGDAFATVASFAGASRFDRVRIVSCR